MRILAITARHPPDHLGGYELRCHGILQALISRGHQVRVLTTRPCSEVNDSDDGVLRLLHLAPSGSTVQRIAWDYLDLRHIRRTLRQWTPDVVGLFHTLQLTRSLFPFLAGRGLPLVYDEGGMGLVSAWRKHGEWFSLCQRGRGGIIKRALRRAAVLSARGLSGNLLPTEWSWPTNMLIYFNSEYGLARHAEGGVPVATARVIRSGIALDRFGFKPGRRAADAVKLVLPGRIVPGKGIEEAIRATAILRWKTPQLRPRLQVVGPIQNLEYYDAVRQLVKGLLLEEDVAFTAMVPHDRMDSVYHDADFCLLLSQREAFSRIPLEAMACGSVLITNASGGGREIARPGENAIVVPGTAPERIAEEVIGLVQSESDFLRIQQNARRYVEENHDLESYVDKVEAVFAEAAARGAGRSQLNA